jgi:hypothetical protein
LRAAASPAIAAALCWLTLALCGCADDVERDALPIEDDFSGACAWVVDEDEDVSLGCKDDQYRVLFKSTERTAKHIVTERLDDPVDSVAVEADVTVQALSGGGSDDFALSGLVCVVSAPAEPSRGYAFFLGADGSGDRGLAIVKVDEADESLEEDGYFEYLLDERSEEVGEVGAATHVRGECRTTDQGVELAMFLNGEQVGTANDPDGLHPFDGLAFLVISPKAGTDVRYDNFAADALGSD